MTREKWLRSSATPTSAGPRPDVKDPLETSKQGFTDLYKIGIPPLSSAALPFDLVIYPWRAPLVLHKHTPVWHQVYTVYSWVTPIKNTLTEYTLLSHKKEYKNSSLSLFFSQAQKRTNYKVSAWEELSSTWEYKDQAKRDFSINITH